MDSWCKGRNWETLKSETLAISLVAQKASVNLKSKIVGVSL